jgi:hypothetical protein
LAVVGAALSGVTGVVVLAAVAALADPPVVEVAVPGEAAVVVAAAVDASFAYMTEGSITWYCPRNGR